MTTPALGSAVDASLDALDEVSLASLGRAALLNRVDTKYIVPVAMVPALIAACAPTYRALVVDGERTFPYLTRYFDTPELAFFRDHVTGRLPRRKVRIRSYVRGGTCVLELKRKTNGGRTVKLRQAVDANDASALPALARAPFIDVAAPSPDAIRATLDVGFTRATLVNVDLAERVTIDLDLTYTSGPAQLTFADTAIVEVKQERRARTLVTELLRHARYRPARVSKYCVGVAALLSPAPVPTYRRLLTHLHAPSHAALPGV
ncbi:MAG: polyphosphate polymerase domain-containing protein [Gemmatimonadetes bacterium]|nr:polyphosphate polymerase domain-containing protein [Gemmatimonadota bacterium]